MSMSTGGNKGGIQSEINVTPLIDVLLVLLIIFLVVMPIMMKMEVLQIPRKLTEQETVDTNLGMLTLKVRSDLSIEYSDGLMDNPVTITLDDVRRTLQPKLDAMAAAGQAKVVFVDFEKTIPWREVVTTMDTIRAMATDLNKDEVKVALKVKEDDLAPAPL